MPATDHADYFSTQVMRTRRFFLPERRESAHALCVVAGGCEWCAGDFVVDRARFPFWAFEFVARGKGSVMMNGQKHELGAGHAFFYDPRTAHVIRSSAEEPMVKYFFNFTGRRATALMRELELASGTVLRVADAARVISLLEEVVDHALRGAGRAASAALEHALALCADSRQPAATKFDPAHATYLRCLGHLLRNYPVLSSVEQAARACHVSPAYFTRLFQRYGAETPLACLTRLKMEQAEIKLRQPEAMVKNIAAELGYKSAAHFSRVFRRHHGRPPTG